jgi:hypothetical protein
MHFKYLIYSVIWSVFMIFVLLIPGDKLPADQLPIKGFDKIVHFALFFVHYYIWVIGLIKQRFFKLIKEKTVKISLFYSVFLAMLIEFIQWQFITQRSGDWMDVLANVLGISCSYIFFRAIYGKCNNYASYD